jgi:hypothetical protein
MGSDIQPRQSWALAPKDSAFPRHHRQVFFVNEFHVLRWLWDSLRQAPLPQFRQHPELPSVLAACAQGQENRGVLRAEGKLLHLGVWEVPRFSGISVR